MLLSAATPATASEWWYIGYTRSSPNRSAYFLDAESIGSDGQYKTAWTERVLETIDTEGVRRERTQYYLNCEQRQSAARQITRYDGQGDVLLSRAVLSLPEAVTPDSMLGGILSFVCSDGRVVGDQTDGNNAAFAQRRVFADP